MFINELFINVH